MTKKEEAIYLKGVAAGYQLATILTDPEQVSKLAKMVTYYGDRFQVTVQKIMAELPADPPPGGEIRET